MAKSPDMKVKWSFGGKVDPTLIQAAKSVQARVKKIKESGANVGKVFKSAGEKVGGFVKAFSLASIAGGIPSMALMAKGAADAAASFSDLSKTTRVSVKDLSEWQYAANRSGLSSDEFKSSVGNLNKLITDAAYGNQDAMLAFKRAGVSIRDASGKMKSADQIMMEASKTFKKMPEGIYKSSLAMALFGSSGSKMANLLEKGQDGIKSLRKEANEMGMTFSNSAAKSGLEFNDSLNQLKLSLQGTAFSIGKQLYPLITPVIKSISKWVSANRELISTKVAEFITKIKAHLPQIKSFIVECYKAIKTMVTTVDKVAQSMGGWGKVLKYVAIGFAAFKAISFSSWLFGSAKAVFTFGSSLIQILPAISSFGSILISVLSKGLLFLGKTFLSVIPAVVKFGIALMANPIGLIIAGIAALIAAGVLLYKNWDKVSKWIKGIWNGMKSFIAPVVDSFLNGLSKIGNGIRNIWNGIKNYFSSCFSDITSAFKGGFINGIMNLLSKFNPLSMITKAINSIFQYFTGIDLIKEGSGFISSFADGIMNTWSSIKDGIVSTVTGWIPDWVKKGASKISNAFSGSKPESPDTNTENTINLVRDKRQTELANQSKPAAKDLANNMAQSIKNTTTNSTVSPVYSPTISVNINSNDSKEGIKEAVQQATADQQKAFEKMYEKMQNKNLRVGVS